MENKFTDNEIIKALECCITNKCDECAIYKECHNENGKGRVQAVLDLINRQKAMIDGLIAGQETLQKALCDKNAEIERLNVELVGMRGACESYKIHYDKAQEKIKALEEQLDGEMVKNMRLGHEVERLQEQFREVTKKIESEARKNLVFMLKYRFLPTRKYRGEYIEAIIDDVVKEMEGANE